MESPRERKRLLAGLVRGNGAIRLSEHNEGKGRKFFETATREGLEGIIAKNADSLYREGLRSVDWLKVKGRNRQEVVIGGFTQPRGSRTQLGALVVGVYEGDELVYVGHTGGGFNHASLKLVRGKLDPLVQRQSPFRAKPKTNMPVQWVKPELVCEVEFHGWTQDGIMRMPIFLGLREDKDPRAVRREMPQVSSAQAVDESTTTKRGSNMPRPTTSTRKHKSGSTARQGKAELTSLDKVYFPGPGYTKGDVIDYYREIAPFILPYLRDRPLSLLRHPNGVAGKSFFQKDVSRQPPPDWVDTVTIPAESTGKDVRYIICQDRDTLLYVANLGTIELNPWNSRVQCPNNPDYLVIDLDPEGVPFTAVVEAAQHVRELLEEGCTDSYCKTSGKTGLHVYIPLGARYDFEQVRQFAEVIARLIHEQLPETTSVERRPAKRRHKVYLDFLQNSIGQTLAAPYSLRPTPQATVSTPLNWPEVNRKLDPTKFTLRTMPRRLDKHGDLWKPVLGKGIDLGKCLAALER